MASHSVDFHTEQLSEGLWSSTVVPEMNLFVYLRVKNKLIKSDSYSKYKIIVKNNNKIKRALQAKLLPLSDCYILKV